MLLDSIFGLENRTARVITGAGLDQDATAIRIFGDSGKTTSGVSVTETTAQTLSAVYRGVALLSSTVASLPLLVYEHVGDDGDKKPARRHPAYSILHSRPNPAMTAFFYRQAAMAYVLLYGRHYSYIERDRKGQVVGLWPMRTQDVRRGRLERGLTYEVSAVKDNDLFPRPPFAAGKPILFSDEVVELTTFDGESIIAHAREQLGEAVAAQNFGGGFYAGGAQPNMVITFPGKVDADDFRKNWQKVHGTEKRQAAVLQNGADAKAIGMPLDDAQFLESRKFYVTEIARWFGIPPHKLMDLERATFSNIEEQNLEWYESLIPWLEMIEQEADRQVLTAAESEQYFCEHNVAGLLRGNIQARYQAYATGIQWGYLNRNEVRRRENLNSMGEDGDVYMVPANMLAAEKLSEPTPEPVMATGLTAPIGDEPDDDETDASDRARDAARRSLVEAVARMLAKEAAEVRNAAAKPQTFLAWLDDYATKWPVKWQTALSPSLAVGRAVGIVAEGIKPEERCAIVKAALLDLSGHTKAAELVERVESEVANWPTAESFVNHLLGDKP